MKEQFNSPAYVLGHNVGTLYTAYGLDLHRLIQSTGNRRLKGGRWSGGGGFLVHHRTIILRPGDLPSYTWNGYACGGPSVPSSSDFSPFTSVLSPSMAGESLYTSPYGATGYARARPGNPSLSLFQYMVEGRESGKLLGDRSIWKGSFKGIPLRALRALSSLRGLGKAYLNAQFGWKPLLSDLREMYELTAKLDERLGALRRNNGKGIHRERVLVNSSSSESVTTDYNRSWAVMAPTPLLLNTAAGSTTQVVTTQSSERIWFEGRFRYWIPDIGSPGWTDRARRKLYGVDVSPSALWEVMPWSWLIDWFSNAGDVLSNMSANAAENVAADYAYVMRTSKSVTTEEISTNWAARAASPEYPAGSASMSKTQVTETKSRVAASPFGFGLTYDGLSGYQQSILAALGMSKFRGFK